MVLKVPSFSRCFVCAGTIQCNNVLFISRDWVSARGKAKFIPHKNCLNSHHIKQSFHFDFQPVRGKSYGVIPTVDFSFGFLFWMNSKLFFLVKLAQRAMAAGAGSRRQWQAISSYALPHVPCGGWKHRFSTTIHLLQALHGKHTTKRLLKTREQIWINLFVYSGYDKHEFSFPSSGIFLSVFVLNK